MKLNLNSAAITAPPQLETDRLILRPVSDDLRSYVFIGLSDQNVRKTMKMPVLNTAERQDAWWQRFSAGRQNGQIMQWCAFYKDSGKYVALLTVKEIEQEHYRGEVGYSVMKEEWGKGIAGEAVRRIVDFSFEEVGLHTLFAMILPYNTPSQRIVKRLGFEQEARFRDIHFYEGKFYDVLQFYKINPAHL